MDGPPQVVGDFPGLINNVDGRDLPPGAGQVQVNLQSRVQGNLQTRKGLARISFEQTTTVTLVKNT